MSVKISARYAGNKRVELTHEQSGATIATDAPLDNNGKGEAFSPTDMVAGALGACAMTIIAIVGEREGIDLTGMRMEAEKIMGGPPRRITGLPVTVHMPAHLSAEQRGRLERAAAACPVANSLHPEIKVQLGFVYDA